MGSPAFDDAAAAERWFVAHGLPYFVDGNRAAVGRGLRRNRILAVIALAVVVGAAGGALVGARLGTAAGVGGGMTVAGGALAVYAVLALRGWLIVTWAVRRTLRSLGLMVPLVTRALPLLLLFITFLFINAEVWQVAASLDGGVLWVTVLLFAALAVGFLLTRLPDELDSVDAAVGGLERANLVLVLLFITFLFINAEVWQVAASLDGGVLWVTVLLFAALAVGFLLTRLPEELDSVDAAVGGLERANLVLVLLIAQAVQVLLLALAVFAFFIVFGVVAMEPAVVGSWTNGGEVHALVGPVGDWIGPRLSQELIRVSVFLAAFSGLYFTVYAVTDELYRRQFFSVVIRELERAVGARVAYRALRDAGPTA